MKDRNLVLTTATPEELTFILDLQKKALIETASKVHGSWNDELQRQKMSQVDIESFEIVSIAEKRIGALQLLKRDNIFEFERLYILPAEQSKGYGSLVIGKILARAQKERIQEIFCKVYKVNERAIALYQRMGCEIVEELELHYRMSYKLSGNG